MVLDAPGVNIEMYWVSVLALSSRFDGHRS